jgi:hypothetical protein
VLTRTLLQSGHHRGASNAEHAASLRSTGASS